MVHCIQYLSEGISKRAAAHCVAPTHGVVSFVHGK